MSKGRNQHAESTAPVPSSDGAGAIVLSDSESWAADTSGLPSVEEVVEGLGLTYIGMADDIPEPIRVPAPLFARIQRLDREQADVSARKQDLLELAVDLLAVDRSVYAVSIDLDTGIVTLNPLEQPA